MMDKTSLERSKSKAEKHKVKAQDETNIKPGILRHATEPVRSRKPKDSSEENLRHRKHSESSKTSSSAKREHRSRKSSDHDRSHRSRSANPRTGTPEHHKKHRSASEHRRHHEHENPEDEKNCDKCQRRRLKRAREALKMGHAKPKSKEKEKEKKKTKPPTTNPPGAASGKKPERRLTCIACLDDELPRNKVAHLTCGHYFCHTCLRRLFKLSLTDPAHMPPKCCTNDHIPLKHVEKLLSDQTKQLWNKKYKEFTTKNRIYCPVPNCGEWIPPEAIHKKIGKCSKCKTKVCAMCNAKAHGKEECPKDPELLKFLDAAHENKYQRCYNCKRFVELDKGCNHMTCPCTAEFCYICGSQWKTCDCPILNAEPDDDAAEPGQGGAFQLPFGLGNLFGFARTNVEPARPGPRNALERQIWEDELLARQLADEEERDAMPRGEERIRVVDAGNGRETGGIRNGIRSLAAAQEGVYARPSRAPLPPVTTNTAATGRVAGGQTARAPSTTANNPAPVRGGGQTARASSTPANNPASAREGRVVGGRTSSTSAINPAPVREGRTTAGQTARTSSTAAAPARGGSQTARTSTTPATNPVPAREGRVASSQTARTSTTPATNPAPDRESKARKERRSRKEEAPPVLPPRKKIPQTTTTKSSRAHGSSHHHHHHTHTSAAPATTEAPKSPTTAPAPAAPERRGLFGSLFGGFAAQPQDPPAPATASSPQQQDPPRSRYLSDSQQNTVDTFLNSLPDKPPAPGEPAKASATSGSHPAPQRQKMEKKSGHTRSHTSSMARDFMLWTAGGSTKRRS